MSKEILRPQNKPLAHPKQEPVAWMDRDGNVSDNNDHNCFPIPLYTTQNIKSYLEKDNSQPEQEPAPVPDGFWLAEAMPSKLKLWPVTEAQLLALALLPTAQPAPVPLAHIIGEIDHAGKVWTPAAQRPWVGLTEERIREIWLKSKDHGDDWADVLLLARAFEDEIKRENT
jgi:hypothetical protein